MKRKLTSDECFAKAEAYDSCADHLLLEWTEDELERKVGDRLSDLFRVRANHWKKIACSRIDGKER